MNSKGVRNQCLPLQQELTKRTMNNRHISTRMRMMRIVSIAHCFRHKFIEAITVAGAVFSPALLLSLSLSAFGMGLFLWILNPQWSTRVFCSLLVCISPVPYVDVRTRLISHHVFQELSMSRSAY